MPKIVEVNISNFRGISIPVMLNFQRGTDDGAHSVIILGDNGSGKSSIVEAIEFVLQSRFRRQKLKTHDSFTHRKNQGYPRFSSTPKDDYIIGNFFLTESTRVSIKFDDGTSQKRIIKMKLKDNSRTWQLTSGEPHEAFTFSPVIIRRSDFLSFWTVDPSKREEIFIDFLSGVKHTSKERDLPTEALKKRIRALKEKLLVVKRKKHRKSSLIQKKFREENNLDESDYIMWEGNAGFVHSYDTNSTTKYPFEIHSKELRSFFNEEKKLSKEENDIEEELKKSKQLLQESLLHEELVDVFSRMSAWVTENFLKISRERGIISHINRIEFLIGDKNLIDFQVILPNGIVVEPQQVFSEAYLDLLSLLIFIAPIKDSIRRNQGKVLILDDVFQSVDSILRQKSIEWLLEEFSNWQLIITLHDRLTFETFRQYHNGNFVEYEIINWSSNGGLELVSRNSRTSASLVEQALRDGDSLQICLTAGRFLEEICDVLSFKLPVSLTRLRVYTLRDMWKPILKTLKKTTISTIAENLNRFESFRNWAGAHFNEWALGLSLADARAFGNAVLELFHACNCDTCYRWIERMPLERNRHCWVCRCGDTRIELTS